MIYLAGTDFSHLTDEEILNGIKALNIPDYIRTKSYGVDVRETLAQMTEMLMQLAYNQGMDPQEAQEFVYEINNKIDKGNVTMSDLTQEVKEALTGGAVAVVGVNSVGTINIEDKAVTSDKTNFIGTGKNILNPSYFIEGQVYNVTDGLKSSGNSVFHLIKASPNTTYAVNDKVISVVYFNKDKEPINATTSRILETSSATEYISVNVSKDGNYAQVEEGNVSTAYEQYYEFLLFDKEEENILEVSKAENLFNPAEARLSSQLKLSQGGIIVDDFLGGLATTGYIEVLPDQYYELEDYRSAHQVAQYDKDFNYLVGLEKKRFRTTADTKYVVFNFPEQQIENIIFQRTVNILDLHNFVKGQIIDSNGALVASASGASSTKRFDVEPNTTYNKNWTSGLGHAFYNSNGAFISYASGYSMTTPSNATQAIVNFGAQYDPKELTLIKDSEVEQYKPLTFSPYGAELLNVKSDDTVFKIGFDLDEETSKVERFDGFDNPEEVMKQFPFSQIRLCNVSKTPWGANKITYETEAGFKRDGSNGDVMVEIPKHYFKRYRITQGIAAKRYEFIELSGQPRDGFKIDPVFIEDGKELDYVYISAYDGHVDTITGDLVSWSGVQTDVSRPFTDYKYRANKKGSGFGLIDYRTISMLQRLFMILYADRNSQKVLGKGITEYSWQSNSECVARLTANNSNVIRINNNSNFKARGFAVNQIVQVREDGRLGEHSNPRKVLSVEVVDADYVDITFDGAPLNLVAGTSRIYTVPQMTGTTDSLNGLNGMGNYFDGRDGHEGIKFLGIENPWGSVWTFIDGLVFDELVTYVGENSTEYSITEYKNNYLPLAYKAPLQPNNTQDAREENEDFVKELSLDPQDISVMIPSKLGDGAGNQKMYSDMFYTRETGARVAVWGGGTDHSIRAGIFTLRATYDFDQNGWLLCGARIQFKNI